MYLFLKHKEIPLIQPQARNGGHLAAHVASGYSHFSRLYDSQEVKRCFEVEQHTVSTLVSIIKENGWEKYVDLVEGGRNYLMFSENELMAQKLDWKKSIEAGIITEDAGRWYTADETNEVGQPKIYNGV